MIICGLKLTHDGAIALIEGGQLKFSIEIEKINNNPRYASIDDTELIKSLLDIEGFDYNKIDKFVIDGWGGFDADAVAIQPRLAIHPDYNLLTINNDGVEQQLKVAQYREKSLNVNLLQPTKYEGLVIDGKKFEYESYHHVTGHITSAYASSPFADKRESAYVLVWDGGMFPRLYFFDAERLAIENLGPIFLLIGNIYTIFSQHFGPFKVSGNFAKDDLSIAGKVMAYIAKGNVNEDLFPLFEEIYSQCYDAPMGFANVFANEFKKRIQGTTISDEDILRTFHVFLEKLLIEKLRKKIQRNSRDNKNLCFAGGCALNIKWNSAIRNSGIFDAVYVPPFPNDSGSAIGMACASMINNMGKSNLDWDVYSGPEVRESSVIDGWKSTACSVEELAKRLYLSNEPIVFLNNRAELGPRALGNRSILASPASAKMKEILNHIKKRESYRPVSPICLENRAEEIFSPGCADPYMLFDHQVRPEWALKIPAVIHLDGTARLQTVTAESNLEIARLLKEFERLSGIPLLCNTSANYKGSGFFPDVLSVAEWGGVNYIWSNNQLFEKLHKVNFETIGGKKLQEMSQ